jgi:4-amino-4-deoxy-L-arabinose transferase-like glycosyltransferase
MPKRHRVMLGLVVIGLVLAVSLIDLDRVPPFWWDEGWTLDVAKNWVERGFYGHLLNGEPAPPGLSAAFPTVASIALSFELLGVGVAQARLVGLIYTAGVLIVWYLLTRRLYDQRTAIAALVVLLLLAPHPLVHPIYVGRQVLAEMQMMFFLLAGYGLFWLALRRSPWWLAPAIGTWGLALIAKAQTLPFWAVSLSVPLLWAVVQRQRRIVVYLAAALVGSYAAFWLWAELQGIILSGHTLATAPLEGLYNATALVTVGAVRLDVLVLAGQIALPTVCGVGYVAARWFIWRKPESLDVDLNVLRLALLTLTAAWLIWFVTLSMGVVRYLFPPVLVGSVFTSVLLRDATCSFRLREMLRRAARALTARHWSRAGGPLLVVGSFIAMFLFGAQSMLAQLRMDSAQGSAVTDVAAYLNTHAGAQALVESYDVEIFPFLNSRYHFPPDQTHVDLIQRLLLNHQPGDALAPFDLDLVPINYDPLAADPDYLVVGAFGRIWRLYEPVLRTNAFRLVQDFGVYQIYQRVR